MGVNRFEIWLVDLDPTIGSEISKTRPCAIISPDVTNRYLKTVTIAALTSSQKAYPTRVSCVFKGKTGQIALDQIRSIDKMRLVKKIGKLDTTTAQMICEKMQSFFSNI